MNLALAALLNCGLVILAALVILPYLQSKPAQPANVSVRSQGDTVYVPVKGNWWDDYNALSAQGYKAIHASRAYLVMVNAIEDQNRSFGPRDRREGSRAV
jgi:hypothetical protein